MTKQKKNLKTRFENSIFSQGEFYIKLSLTILLAIIFIIIFVTQNGYRFFQHTAFVDNLKGKEFQVHFINVENGDAILIKLPSDQVMMIDTGDEKYEKEVTSYVDQFLDSEGLEKIDYLFLTHPDSDHVGSAVSILNKFEVVNLYRPKIYSQNEFENIKNPQSYQISDTEIYSQVIDKAYEKNCNISFNEAGIKLNFGSCVVEFLAPLHNEYSFTNNYSAVILVTYQSNRFLFMGDAPISVEEELIRRYGEKLQADVLKVGHHGSYTSTSQSFINVVKPQYAVLSCKGSEYFPHKDVVEILNKSNVDIFSTAVRGSFAMTLQEGKIIVENAEYKENYIAIIFTVFLVFIFILWTIPFKSLIPANLKAKKVNK